MDDIFLMVHPFDSKLISGSDIELILDKLIKKM